MEEGCECKPGAPAWMATFGDMMSLLLTFFILIVSFSSIQEVEFQKAIGSLKGALGVLKTRRSTMNLTSLKNVPLDLKKMATVYPEIEQLKEMLEEMKVSEHVEVETLPNSVKFTMQDQILFPLGRAEVNRKIFPVLFKISEMARKVSGVLRIEGHSDDLPIHTEQYPSNWELSSMRAINILHYFENMGISREKLSCAGYADTRPIAPNDSAENRAKNRRVEIYLELEKDGTIAAVDSVSIQDLKYLIPKQGNMQFMRTQPDGR